MFLLQTTHSISIWRSWCNISFFYLICILPMPFSLAAYSYTYTVAFLVRRFRIVAKSAYYFCHVRLSVSLFVRKLSSQLPRSYPYSDAVEGIEWLNDPDSFVGGSVATRRVSHAREVKGDSPDKRGNLALQGEGLGVGLTTPPRKICLLRNFNQSLGKGKCLDWRSQGPNWAIWT